MAQRLSLRKEPRGGVVERKGRRREGRRSSHPLLPSAALGRFWRREGKRGMGVGEGGERGKGWAGWERG